MIRVVAFLTAHSDKRDVVLDALRENGVSARRQPGCIEYAPTVDVPDGGPLQTPVGPNCVVVVEAWDSLDALHAHAAGDHMAKYRKKVEGLVASRVVHVLHDDYGGTVTFAAHE